MLLINILCCIVIMEAIAIEFKTAPTISENFVVNLRELDSTNTTILNERLAWDVDLRRTAMYAEGTLVHGAMQQIKRCDLVPLDGWLSSSGGEDVDHPETWSCTNMTIDVPEETSDDNCGIGNFWNFPDTMKYEGDEEIDGVVCGKWSYWSGPEQYGVWITDDAVPCASGKLRSAVSSTWMIYYTDFKAGPPPESEYDPVEGCECPASTPPSAKYNKPYTFSFSSTIKNLMETYYK